MCKLLCVLLILLKSPAGYAAQEPPHCEPACAANAYCSAPNACSCQLGFYPSAGVCHGLCSEGYSWDPKSEGCESRCRPGSRWDRATQMCVQQLQAQVELIAKEADILIPKAEDRAQKESLKKGTAEESATVRTLCVAIKKDCYNLEVLIASAENTTEAYDKGLSQDPSWLDTYNILLILSALSLLLAVVGYVGLYFWKLRQEQHMLVLESKLDLSGEYELDRSQIMVY